MHVLSLVFLSLIARTRPKGFKLGSDELRKYQYLFGTLGHIKCGLLAVLFSLPVSYWFKYPFQWPDLTGDSQEIKT